MPRIFAYITSTRNYDMRRNVVLPVWIGVLALSVAPCIQALAQQPSSEAAVSSGPRFLLTSNDRSAPLPIDVSRTAALRKRLTLDLKGASTKEALAAISAQSGIKIFYVDNLLAGAQSVRLRAEGITVAAALTDVLSDLNVDVLFSPDGSATLITRSPATVPPPVGTIVGRVTDVVNGRAIEGVQVAVQDTKLRAMTADSGRYRLTNVPVGRRTVTARIIGYATQRREVLVADGEEVTADFSLQATPTQLNDVVTTATGEQRYRELGHVVVKINADSLVKEAPITSLSELLTARVPGLQVMNFNGGIVGGEVALRLRGTTTTLLDPQPIVIVDGVRYKNTNSIDGSSNDSRPFNAEPRSPLNDLNVNDVETIEVVKGPSASTLYGPDAANGVIVVTTKRGLAGKPQWHVYVYPDLTTLGVGSKGRLDAFPGYQGWGHVPGTGTLYAGQCSLAVQAAQLCVLDSLTVAKSAMNDPQTSVLAKQRPQWHSGMSVSGGIPQFLYFFSGNYDVQTGSLRLSPVAATLLKSELGVETLSNAIRTPNSQETMSLHTNVSSVLNPKTSITFAANYTQGTQRSIDVSNLMYNYTTVSPFEPGTAYSHSDSLNYLRSWSNPGAFLSTTAEQFRRLTATLAGSYQATPWLGLNGSVGTDLDNTIDRGVQANAGGAGEADDYHRNNTNRNAHIGATAVAHPGILSFRSSVGADYSYTNVDGINAGGYGLAPGSTDLSTASSQSVRRLWNEAISLGSYGEEVVGLGDRLFVTGSLRLDGSTSFGDKYVPHPFPKIGVSWVVSEEPWLAPLNRHGLDELRLRYSYGAASRYPVSAMKIGSLGVQNVPIEGTTNAAFTRFTLGNPSLRPERTRESEYGFDATLAKKVQVGLTWFKRRSNDVLQQVGAPAMFPTSVQNVGDLSAHGFEGTVGVKVVESYRASLDLKFSYANIVNKVLSVGAAREFRDFYGSVAVGYPLNAVFASTTTGYADTLGGGPDGFISDPSEVISSPIHYLGVLEAPRTYTFTPTLTLFGGRIRVSSLFDGQAGGIQLDPFTRGCPYTYTCSAAFLRSTPLLQQAKHRNLNEGDFVLASDLTRWREVSVTGELPLGWRKRLHLTRASASVQMRNLALWTHFPAPDPESVPGLGTNAIGTTGFGAVGVPQPRTWAVRFDISPW